eukprot:6270488-Amphidinium_carterae.1
MKREKRAYINDEALPQAPELPEDYEPFTEEVRKTINDYKETLYCYSRVLQYTLNKTTKGEPH